MKKAIAGLLLIALTASLIPWTLANAGLRYTPHEDPATAESLFQAPSLLGSWGLIMELISGGDFSNADSVLEQLKRAEIPAELRDAFDLYNSSLFDVSGELDSIDKLLREVDSFMSQNRLAEAEEKLTEAGTLLDAVEGKLGELTEATQNLGLRLGVFAVAAESSLRKAYDHLNDMVDRAKNLRGWYEELYSQLEAEVEEKQQELTATQITLNLSPTEVWVGESVSLNGTLTDENGNPLPGREITLYMAGTLWGTASTNGNGDYNEELTVPYNYTTSMTVRASYVPGDDDKDTYQACSKTTTLSILFYDTYLELTEVPEEAYPGLPGRVSGTVTFEGVTPLDERMVKMFLGGTALAQGETNDQGEFHLEAALPVDIAVGDYALKVTVVSKERYSGVSQDVPANVTKLVPELSAHIPGLRFSATSMKIDGSVVYENTPLKDATVTVTFRGRSMVTVTSEDGSFSFALDVPLGPTVMGSQSVEVSVEPAEPWFDSVQTEASVFVINFLNIGFLCAALIGIGAVVYNRRRRRPGVPPPPEEAMPPTEAAEMPPAELRLRLAEPRERVLAAYYDAVRAVEGGTGVSMQPQKTFREFLGETRDKLGKMGETFAELTWAAERARYSSVTPRSEDVTRAEGLARGLREELGSGMA